MQFNCSTSGCYFTCPSSFNDKQYVFCPFCGLTLICDIDLKEFNTFHASYDVFNNWYIKLKETFTEGFVDHQYYVYPSQVFCQNQNNSLTLSPGAEPTFQLDHFSKIATTIRFECFPDNENESYIASIAQKYYKKHPSSIFVAFSKSQTSKNLKIINNKLILQVRNGYFSL